MSNKTTDGAYQHFLTAWLSCISMMSTFAFVAAAYYKFLIGSLVIGLVAVYSMRRMENKKFFCLLFAASVLAGMICQLFFWRFGRITAEGVIFVVLPLLGYEAYATFAIYMREKTVQQVG